MNKKNLDYFEKRLKQELESPNSGVDCNFEGLTEPEDKMPDLLDRASSFIDRRLSQDICVRDSLRIRKIEQALEDISKGVYGICWECGEDITIKRLKATPEARQCIRCKTEIEKRERLARR